MLYSTIVGIDTHARKNTVTAIITETGEIRQTELPAEPGLLVEWISTQELPDPIMAVYESGPTGFPLARTLMTAGITCSIAATSKLPLRKDRKKNDLIDSEWLARQCISGSIRTVRIPTPEEESLRGLNRLRAQAVKDLTRAKKRVSSFLLLRDIRRPGKTRRWSMRFKDWIERLEFDQPIDRYVLDEMVAEVYHLEGRVAGINAKIDEVISSHPWLKEQLDRLQCIHGIGRVISLTLVSEIMDFNRFKNGAAFASFVGLVPSEHSSGDKNAKGSITKTGNAYVRTALVEAANCYLRPFKSYSQSVPTVDPLVRAHATKCTTRLKKRALALKARKKQTNKIKIAIAREMAEWVYHIAVM